MTATDPDQAVVTKFAHSGDLPPKSLPVASLCILWYVEEDGIPGMVSQFDGEQSTSVTVGDLTGLIHQYLHLELDEE